MKRLQQIPSTHLFFLFTFGGLDRTGREVNGEHFSLLKHLFGLTGDLLCNTFFEKETFCVILFLFKIKNLDILLLYSRIIVAAAAVEKERSRRLTTAILNQVVREAVAFKAPPRTRGGKRGRVYYSTQVNFIWKDAFTFTIFHTRKTSNPFVLLLRRQEGHKLCPM